MKRSCFSHKSAKNGKQNSVSWLNGVFREMSQVPEAIVGFFWITVNKRPFSFDRSARIVKIELPFDPYSPFD